MSLTSGNSYPLSTIFNGKRSIIIPDLQRDYCWGTVKGKDGKSLAQAFCHDLLGLWRGKNSGTVSLGLIYAYEHPKDSGLIHIADGQQRLTTFYLLLLAVCKRCPHLTEVRHFIDKGQCGPRLQFEIRDSTRYFLSGLLKHLHQTVLTAGGIESASWFRQSYKHDPSVVNMCKALGHITSDLEKCTDDDLRDFGEFILGAEGQGIRLVYFDVKDRNLGEKLYVIINSRGAPMEESEHIKPLLIGGLLENRQREWTETWEQWQDFFWQERRKTEHSGDAGFDEFLAWHMHIEQADDKGRIYTFYSVGANDPETTLAALRRRFNAAKQLTDHLADPRFQTIFTAISGKQVERLRDLKPSDIQLVIYPLLVSTETAGVPSLPLLRHLRRNRFDKEPGRWVHRDRNAIEWKPLLNGHLPPPTQAESWRKQEEAIKDWLRESGRGVADCIDEWEDHCDLQGDLWPLIRAITPAMETAEEVVVKIQQRQASDVLRDLSATFGRLNALQSSNLFEVLKVCWGSFPVGKLYQVNHQKYGIDLKKGNLGHLHQTGFWRVLGAANLAEALKPELIDYFSRKWPTQNACLKTLTLWMLLKSLHSDASLSLSRSDYLAACWHMPDNKLLPDLRGSLGNLYCGRAAMKSTWWCEINADEGATFHAPLVPPANIPLTTWQAKQKWLQTLPREPLEMSPEAALRIELAALDCRLRDAVKTFFGAGANDLLEAFVAHIDGQ